VHHVVDGLQTLGSYHCRQFLVHHSLPVPERGVLVVSVLALDRDRQSLQLVSAEDLQNLLLPLLHRSHGHCRTVGNSELSDKGGLFEVEGEDAADDEIFECLLEFEGVDICVVALDGGLLEVFHKLAGKQESKVFFESLGAVVLELHFGRLELIQHFGHFEYFFILLLDGCAVV
jgi:hypothetical protein